MEMREFLRLVHIALNFFFGFSTTPLSNEEFKCKCMQRTIYKIANHGKRRKCKIKISSNYHVNETIELNQRRMANDNEMRTFIKKAGERSEKKRKKKSK